MGLALVITAVSGCRFYWSKPGGTEPQFAADSKECAIESSPSEQARKYQIATEKIYMACMKSWGWVRENSPGGEGKFRAIEDWD
jgi:hypothetical protein